MKFFLQRGVTLVELVMAIAILTVIGIPAGLMIGEQIQGMMTATDLTTAANLGRFEMEKLNNLAYASITSGTSNYAGYPYDVTRAVTTTTDGGTATRKDITITVKRTGDASTLVTLYSTIAGGVSYAP